MANPFMLNDRPRAGALADAAERLGRVASVVKDQQIARNQPGHRPPESDVFALSPEEAWSKKYMIQCVGPVCTIQPTVEAKQPADAAALLLPRFAAGPAVVAQAPQTVAVEPSNPVAARADIPARPSRKAAAEPIGLAIGKPVRKRSLIGRLFRR
jgi:hypothetical protein